MCVCILPINTMYIYIIYHIVYDNICVYYIYIIYVICNVMSNKSYKIKQTREREEEEEVREILLGAGFEQRSK